MRRTLCRLNIYLKSIIAASLIFTYVDTNAQKLPIRQDVSLRVPLNLKIDGKINELGEFQAYNPATELFYTLANDDKRIYFFIQCVGRDLINKIVNGGIRIDFQGKSIKSDVGAVTVKFPFFEKGKYVFFNLQPGIVPTKMANQISDSITRVNNKKLASISKWVYFKNANGKDSLISVYNDIGIQAANSFDLKKNYVCELAIDIELLGLSNNSKFNYHIIVNGEPNKYSLSEIMNNGPRIGKNADGTQMSGTQIDAAIQSLSRVADMISATTDFWGEYTFAK